MALSEARLKQVFGAFSYTEDPKRKGAVIIEPGWVRQNLTHINTGFGRFACHRLIAYQAETFVFEGEAENLISDIGGIWVARHILWDPKRPLSGHAYGCDIDLNVDDGLDGPGGKLNYANNSFQPRRLIALAGKWGFEWGGAWRTAKDGMHFSFARIIPMKLGARGGAVKELQRRLNDTGYQLVADGIFGPKTRVTLEDWQGRHGLPVTGSADAHTLRILYK